MPLKFHSIHIKLRYEFVSFNGLQGVCVSMVLTKKKKFKSSHLYYRYLQVT